MLFTLSIFRVVKLCCCFVNPGVSLAAPVVTVVQRIENGGASPAPATGAIQAILNASSGGVSKRDSATLKMSGRFPYSHPRFTSAVPTATNLSSVTSGSSVSV